MPTIYTVSIAKSTGAAPNDGFIDNVTIEQYMAAASPTSPTTYALSTAKERGNIRFDFLQQQLQLEANVYVAETVSTGADANTEASTFVFKATVERGDDVLVTRDENNTGRWLTGAAALKRWIARALISQRTCFGDIYDPTTDTTAGNSTPAVRFGGPRTVQVTVGPAAANLTAATALVTVTKL